MTTKERQGIYENIKYAIRKFDEDRCGLSFKVDGVMKYVDEYGISCGSRFIPFGCLCDDDVNEAYQAIIAEYGNLD